MNGATLISTVCFVVFWNPVHLASLPLEAAPGFACVMGNVLAGRVKERMCIERANVKNTVNTSDCAARLGATTV